MSQQNKIPLKKALVWLLGSVLAVFIPLGLGLLYYKYLNEQRQSDPQYDITAIVQNSSGYEMLRSGYLAEILKLSIDKPTNLFIFDSKMAERKLLESPLIKEAKIQKIRPGTILVHYTPAVPIAYLADLKNAAIDQEGAVIPFQPFFSPKKLPEIYLGINDSSEEVSWGKKILETHTDLALKILQELTPFQNPYFILKKIDVSKAFASSYGEREIIVTFEEVYIQKKNDKTNLVPKARILRFSEHNLKQQFNRYLLLAKHRREQKQVSDTIFDLRIPQLAFVK